MTTLFWLFLGVFSMVNWALITDVIDYSELKNGVREDGTVYALYSFARKLGQALASNCRGDPCGRPPMNCLHLSILRK